MDHFAGLDVSVNETSVCIVDDTGQDYSGNQGRERTCAVQPGVSALGQ
jgi:hypothetical protein